MVLAANETSTFILWVTFWKIKVPLIGGEILCVLLDIILPLIHQDSGFGVKPKQEV